MVERKAEELPSEMREALTSAGVVGFDPVTDAIKDTRIGRIYYIKNNEIKWTSPPKRHQKTWLSPGTMNAEKFKNAFNDADGDDMKIIDKTVFNQLTTGPLKDIPHAHDGLAWGITLMCEYKLQRGEKPSWSIVKAVQGMGETLTEKFMHNFDSYTAPTHHETEPTGDQPAN